MCCDLQTTQVQQGLYQGHSDFVGFMLRRYDKILMVRDFNLHVCCPLKPMAREFLDFIEAFNLTQHITGSTHVHGHTLDLVVSFGLPVDNVCICDVIFSDHRNRTGSCLLCAMAVLSRLILYLTRPHS